MFGGKKKKERKNARNLLGHAQKVINYRRDVLSDDAVADIRAHKTAVEQALKDGAEGKALEEPVEELHGLLRKHGGRIYPVTFGSENVEMVLVAVILAIGIRTYFFQPFKIPTNSMWPTYAGLNAKVYPPDKPRPNLVEQAFFGITQGLPQSVPFLFGQFNYYVTAPNRGELIIPLVVGASDAGNVALPISEPYETGIIGNLGRSVKKRYKLLVGETIVDVETPGDFDLSEVILQSWFPEYDSLFEVYEAYEAKGQVGLGVDRRQRYIKTGVMLEPGDGVLSFNIDSGDMLFVDRFTYNFVPPKVGAPIVFRTDNIPGLRLDQGGVYVPDQRYYIKRLVGTPGDELQVRGNTLYRNGDPIEGAEAFELNAEEAEGYAGYQARRRLADGLTENIPPGFFYAMGDNSPYSLDSRAWGYQDGFYVDRRTPAEIEAGVPDNMVPEKDVVGRASFIFYPFTHRWGPAK